MNVNKKIKVGDQTTLYDSATRVIIMDCETRKVALLDPIIWITTSGWYDTIEELLKECPAVKSAYNNTVSV